MLTCKVGEEIVNTIEYEDGQIRKWSNKGILKCPVCESKMIYRHGEIKIAHFAHIKDADCADIYSELETEEHLKGKKFIFEWLKTQEGINNLKLEAWIPETKQRPDLYFEVGGKRYVIEFQCTPIATQYLERHRLYQLAGIFDIWILGIKKYNINLEEKKITHIDRFKEIERHSDLYFDVENEVIVLSNKIISNYFEHKILELDKYYNYPINNMKFDINKSQISPIRSILDKFIKRNYKKYLEEKEKIDRIEKEEQEYKIKQKNELITKQKLKIEVGTLINSLNEKYKRANKNCKFEFNEGNSSYYLGRIDFTSDYKEFTFFIKTNCTDCCILCPCTKVDYLGGRGKNGGLRRRYYQSTQYVNKDSIEYENIDMQIIKDFICTAISNSLRKYRYGIE